MATTQNTYTGNGSTTNYSFTFEYLKQSDVKVTLDTVATTAFTFANATTLSFTSAPANNVAIRIFRDTAIDTLSSTFFPGSAIKAEDLNQNFTQSLYVTQESETAVDISDTTANAAKTTAEGAVTTANSAVTTANSAVTTANSAVTTANSAVTTANTADTNASAAVTTANAATATANTASTTAASAVTTANTASTTAGSAVTTANSAVTTANSAVSSAATANTTAGNAVTTANAATTAAAAAQTTANGAVTTANSAVTTANTANTTAGSAVTTANSAVSTANTANTNASAAVVTANAAASAVSDAVLFTLVANVAAIPGSPADQDYVEVIDSTGIQSFSPLSGVPSGFTGASGLTVRIRYSNSASSWEYLSYFANDPEDRYLTKNIPLGSATAPSFAFTGDTNTGIYSPGADQVAITTGGTGRLYVDSSGNIGIGTSSPGSYSSYANNLVVNESGNAGISISSTDSGSNVNSIQFTGGTTRRHYIECTNGSNGNFTFQTGGTGAFRFIDGSGERVRIDGSGRVGIGTSSINSLARLDVDAGTLPIGINLDSTNTGGICNTFKHSGSNKLTIGTGGSSFLTGSSTADGLIRAEANLVIAAGGNNERLRIDSSGNVGIGTSSPDANLDFGATSNDSYVINLRKSGNSRTSIGVNAEYGVRIAGPGDATAIASFGVTDSSQDFIESVRITNSGNVGIGTTSPSGLLAVHQAASSTSNYINITNNQTGASSWSNGMLVGVNASGDALCWQNESSNLLFGTSNTERMRIDSSGRVGIGTTSFTSGSQLSVQTTAGKLEIIADGVGGTRIYNSGALAYDVVTGAAHTWRINNSEIARFDSSGRMLIGTSTAPGFPEADDFTVSRASNAGITIRSGTASACSLAFSDGTGGGAAEYRGLIQYNHITNSLAFSTNSAERMRIDSSGRVGIGTSSPSVTLDVNGGADNQVASFESTDAEVYIAFKDNTTTNAAGNRIGATGDSLFFSTTNGTERMRIDSSGNIFVNKTANNRTDNGLLLIAGGSDDCTLIVTNERTSGGNPIEVNRQGSDGNLISFFQAGTLEGAIVVSGSTVSLSGGHLSRWSQLAGGAERTEILRGSVLSNLDEMCEWGEEDNEQLNRMKVSDVEGDANVAGVFMSWDDDDIYPNDFYCAMTGDFVIRIAQGTTVARGDLLMSAGDGTAKPQDDDIIRSKTIAKVTSTNVSETYADGSYCVPCVLMAC